MCNFIKDHHNLDDDSWSNLVSMAFGFQSAIFWTRCNSALAMQKWKRKTKDYCFAMAGATSEWDLVARF